jgi:hypothetical protein
MVKILEFEWTNAGFKGSGGLVKQVMISDQSWQTWLPDGWSFTLSEASRYGYL